MEARKIFYMLTLCIALYPCAADALFRKWSTKEILSLSSVVITAALVSIYLYRNWSRKETPKKKTDQENNNQPQIALELNTKPEDNADKSLQNLLSRAPKDVVSQPDFNASDTEWVKFIVYRLSTLNSLEQKKFFVNNPSFFGISNCRGMTDKIGFQLYGNTTMDQMSLFNGMVHRGNLMSVNLLLFSGLVDFTAKYISIASDTTFASKLKYLIRLVVHAGGRSVAYGNTNESVVKLMSEVLQSHCATPLNGSESTEIDVDDINSNNKVMLKPLQSNKKLYFGCQKHESISEADCVNQLRKFL